MKWALTIISFMTALSMHAQDVNGLIIDYNLHANKVTYTYNGQVIDKATVKKGDNVYVQISEYNPYALKAEVYVKNSEYRQSASSLSNDGGVSSGNFLSGIGGLLGGLSSGQDFSSAFSGIPGSRGASSAQIMETKSKFNSLINELKNTEQELNESSNKLKKFESLDRSRTMAISDIQKLKSNLLIKPSRLRELMKEELEYAFAKSKGESIQIDDVVNKMKIKEDLEISLAQYENAKDKYNTILWEFKEFNKDIKSLALDRNDAQIEFIYTATDSVENTLSYEMDTRGSAKTDIQIDETVLDKYIEDLSELRQVYEELEQDIFTYKFPPFQADKDEVLIDIQILKNSEELGEETYKSLTQKVEVAGGWKITGGLGLAFGFSKDPVYEYSLNEGFISGNEIDDFTPTIASFAHIYRQTSNPLNFGLSFGLGFPISDSAGRSLNYFLGPTILLGNENRFLLSGGLMGHRVDRLSSGLKIGDAYSSTTNAIPTSGQYELGYFIGISYDIFQ